jgi:hypothetical protein
MSENDERLSPTLLRTAFGRSGTTDLAEKAVIRSTLDRAVVGKKFISFGDVFSIFVALRLGQIVLLDERDEVKAAIMLDPRIRSHRRIAADAAALFLGRLGNKPIRRFLAAALLKTPGNRIMAKGFTGALRTAAKLYDVAEQRGKSDEIDAQTMKFGFSIPTPTEAPKRKITDEIAFRSLTWLSNAMAIITLVAFFPTTLIIALLGEPWMETDDAFLSTHPAFENGVKLPTLSAHEKMSMLADEENKKSA